MIKLNSKKAFFTKGREGSHYNFWQDKLASGLQFDGLFANVDLARFSHLPTVEALTMLVRSQWSEWISLNIYWAWSHPRVSRSILRLPRAALVPSSLIILSADPPDIEDRINKGFIYSRDRGAMSHAKVYDEYARVTPGLLGVRAVL